MQKTPKWNAFEHRAYRLWKQELPSNFKWLIASSGGLDSVVLMHLADQLKTALGLKFRVAYVHHGLSGHKKTDLYRKKAQRFVESWCRDHQVDYVTNIPQAQAGVSEQDFRRLRYDFLLEKKRSSEWLVTAHHESDLFETRVLRLIRGVGPQGMQAMQRVSKPGRILRPLLDFSREELEAYAKERKLSFVQDPSNSSEDFLRNWLRNSWLKSLEKKSPGSLKVWSRSLENLASLTKAKKPRKMTKIARKNWLSLSESEQKEKLAHFLRVNGFKGYGQTHINELRKRLDTRRKRHTFELLGRSWLLDPQHLALERERS